MLRSYDIVKTECFNDMLELCLDDFRDVAPPWLDSACNISAALKVPKIPSLCPSIIVKWKTFGTTRTLLRADCLTELKQPGKKGLKSWAWTQCSPEWLLGSEEPDSQEAAAPQQLVKVKGKLDRAKHLIKAWIRALRNSDLAEGSSSNKTPSPQLRPQRSVLETNLWMFLTGPARTPTWTPSDISGETSNSF